MKQGNETRPDDQSPEGILDFWLRLEDEKTFSADPDFDAEIKQRFSRIHEAGMAGKLTEWKQQPKSALALVILFDQFTRNIYRGTVRAFEADTAALDIAKEAIERGFDLEIPVQARKWFYMPYMHSENLADQERCLELCERSGLDNTAHWAGHHAEIIRRFGRFPHRNRILGRKTTAEEQAFLDEGGFTG